MSLSKLAKLYAKNPELYKLHSQKYNISTAPYLLISSSPPILYTLGTLGESENASLEPIYQYLQDKTAYLLTGWWWDMENQFEVEKLSTIEKNISKNFQNINLSIFVIRCSSKKFFKNTT